jgi:hypothetical protein
MIKEYIDSLKWTKSPELRSVGKAKVKSCLSEYQSSLS